MSQDPKQFFSALYNTVVSTPTITNAKFAKAQGDVSAINLNYSQRDLSTNTFRSLSRIAYNTGNNDYELTAITEASSTISILAPSGKFNITIRTHTNGEKKQTLLEVFDTTNAQLVNSIFLDGVVLSSTPFYQPEWSPDEKLLSFTYLTNGAAAKLQKILDEYYATKTTESTTTDDEVIKTQENIENSLNVGQSGDITEVTPTTKTKDGDDKNKKSTTNNNYTVEQVFSELFTNTDFVLQQHLGEQLTSIDFPQLMVLNVFSSDIVNVFPSSLSSIMMPIQAKMFPLMAFPSSTDKDVVNYAYPVVVTMAPIFGFRGGAIFYATRPSRLYLTTLSVEKVSIVDDNQNQDQDYDIALNDTLQTMPLLYCLTPDAHSTHGIDLYSTYQEKDYFLTSKSTTTFNTQVVENIGLDADYIDILYAEALGFDARWGMNKTHEMLLNNKYFNNLKNNNNNNNTENLLQEYLLDNNVDNYTQKVPAELLTPHNTTLALRCLRLPLRILYSIAKLLNFIYQQIITNATQIDEIKSKKIKLDTQVENVQILYELIQIYDQALPNWPYRVGMTNFDFIFNHIAAQQSKPTPSGSTNNNALNAWFINKFFTTVKGYDQVKELKEKNIFFTILQNASKSLLPVNHLSYGLTISGGFRLTRINANTVIYNNITREVGVVNLLQYQQLSSPSLENQFYVEIATITPPTLQDEQSLLQYQKQLFNSKLDQLNTIYTNPTLNQNTTNLLSLLQHEKEDNTNNIIWNSTTTYTKTTAKNAIVVPKLPINTNFYNNAADLRYTKGAEDVVIGQDVTLLETSPTIQLADISINKTTNIVYLLILIHMNSTTPPFVYIATLDLKTNNVFTTFQQNAKEFKPLQKTNENDMINLDTSKTTTAFGFMSLDYLYDPYMVFHTNESVIEQDVLKIAVDDKTLTTIYEQTQIPRQNYPVRIIQLNSAKVITQSAYPNVYDVFNVAKKDGEKKNKKEMVVNYQRQNTQNKKLFNNLKTITINTAAYSKYGQVQTLATYNTALYSFADYFTENNNISTKPENTFNIAPRGILAFVHGGPHSNWSQIYDFMTTMYALSGFLVLRVNYAGSPGSGEVALRSICGHIGFSDTAEITNAIDIAGWLFGITSSFEDTQQVNSLSQNDKFAKQQKLPKVLVGGSHSGFTNQWMAAYRHWDAVIIRNPVLSLQTTMNSDIYDWVPCCLGFIPHHDAFYTIPAIEAIRDDSNNNNNENTPSSPQQFLQLFSQTKTKNWPFTTLLTLHSPMSYVEHVKSPILYQIGNADIRVPFLQTKTIVKILRQCDVDVCLNVYPKAQHSLNDTTLIHAHSVCSALCWIDKYSKQKQ